ncbi:unnamed protein product [Kuraishia capsulata CBS 1993]|uniref:Uncharacterized protein n=1 Tax=Kuraishia capsulata CBS 1993 TaxID=1382522 RepID=W6MPD2_9ASCO|nr:uncharacterized protein KUCA_T00004512001 [Kuraishia capsulata CBS 1993]CDK28529.1 unnamed protein product [Kuraishia capsulata CBS 1993]
MAVQKEARLDQPLPSEAKPTITSTALTPDLASAVMNLTLETKLSRQSGLNSYLFKDVKTVGLLVVIAASVLRYRLADYFEHVHWRLLLKNTHFISDLLQTVLFIITISAGVFVFLARYTEILKEEVEDVKNNTPKYFGLDLKQFAQLPQDVKDSKYNEKGKLSDLAELAALASYVQVVQYRDVPIASIAIARDEASLRILSYGIRRIYVKSGIMSDLLLWVKFKANTIAKNEKSKVDVTVDMYSFENFDRKLLASAGYSKVSDEKLGIWVLDLYGVRKETWKLSVGDASEQS